MYCWRTALETILRLSPVATESSEEAKSFYYHHHYPYRNVASDIIELAAEWIAKSRLTSAITRYRCWTMRVCVFHSEKNPRNSSSHDSSLAIKMQEGNVDTAIDGRRRVVESIWGKKHNGRFAILINGYVETPTKLRYKSKQ